MNNIFEDLPWHDAELLEVSINRRHPGERDEIRLQVAWPHGEKATLIFGDCYAMTMKMNFGILAEERIANALLLENDPGLDSIQTRWKSLGVSLHPLCCYQIETSSTNSIMKIYAKRFEVKTSAD